MSEREMSDLQELLERRLGRSWAEIVQWMQSENGLDEISQQLSTGDWSALLQTIRAGAERFAADLQAAYVTSAQAAAKWLDGEIDSVVRFDAGNQVAVAWAQANKLELVREITTEQRGVLREVLHAGLADGRNPLDVARDIRGSIGLTEYQAQVVANYRRALEAGDLSGALQRELRDGRYDRSLAAAMRDSRALPPEQIDRMVDAYRRGWVDLRAQTIARTEGLRALHEGTEATFRQAIARGDLDASQLVREWHHANVGKYPRPGHEAMDGQQRKLGQPFLTGDGVSIRYPGDPQAGAEETINCRCVVSTALA